MTHMKAETALEKTHGKGKKKAVKVGNLEEVTTAQQLEIKEQLNEHKEKVWLPWLPLHIFTPI